MLFEELLEEAITEFGGKGLAMEMDMDQADLTRFRQNSKGITIPKIDKLLRLCGYVICKADDRDRLLDVVFTMTDIAREQKRKK